MSAAPETIDRKALRLIMIVLVLVAAAQIVWIIGDFGAERREAMERAAVNDSDELTIALRHETNSAGRHLAAVKAQAETVLKDAIRDRVDEAASIAQSLYEQTHGKISDADARALIREALRRPRFFGGRGYYFIDTLDGLCVLLPTVPELEGKSLLENRDDAGRYIMRELLRAVDNPGNSGFVRYSWYPPGSVARMDDKIAYARKFAPFNWLIGTGDYVSAVEERLKTEMLERFRNIRLIGGGRLAVIDQTGKITAFLDNAQIEAKTIEELPDGPERQALSAIMTVAPSGGVKIALPDAATGRLETWVAWVQTEQTFGWNLIAMAPDAAAHADRGESVGIWWWIGRYLIPVVLMLAAGYGALLIVFGKRGGSDDDERA